MSCAAALVAVMGKLHREEGHTQLESGKSDGSGSREVEREIQEERRKKREGRRGRAQQTRSDLVESWLFVHWVNASRFGWGLSSPALVTAAQMSIKLAPIYCWFARVIRNIPSLPLMGWHRDEGVMEGEKRGEEKMEGESLYCSLSPWMSSAHLLCVPVGQREGGEEEERRSFVPWSGSLAHANRAAASGESLARVLMELGQTHFTA